MGSARKDQHNVGTPSKPRGQQTGYSGNPDQNRQETNATPAVSGREKRANKMFGDDSTQQTGSGPVTPSTNSPSTPAMITPPQNDTGGEKVFKQRLKRKRSSR